MNPIDRRTAGRAVLAAGALAAVGGAARAQTWPTRPNASARRWGSRWWLKTDPVLAVRSGSNWW